MKNDEIPEKNDEMKNYYTKKNTESNIFDSAL